MFEVPGIQLVEKSAAWFRGTKFTRNAEDFIRRGSDFAVGKYHGSTPMRLLRRLMGQQAYNQHPEVRRGAKSVLRRVERRTRADLRQPNVQGVAITGGGQAWTRPAPGREAIAHEAFHAGPGPDANPMLFRRGWFPGIPYRKIPGGRFVENRIRGNEGVTHFVGGYRAPRHAGFMQRMRSGMGSYRHYRTPETQAVYGKLNPKQSLFQRFKQLRSGQALKDGLE